VRESLPERLLLQLRQATPEQFDAIQRLVDVLIPVAREEQPAPDDSPQYEQQMRSMAAKVIELLEALCPGRRQVKAPPITVFLLRYRQNYSRRQIALECVCSESLVAQRLRSIRKKLPWQPRQLQELSSHVEAMQATLSDSRAPKIYRKGAT
jgi:DNA-directed RNA polymerase specialized sigma24 family protein